jgi:hypothetical protein
MSPNFGEKPIGHKWFLYYWILFKHFGAECYKTLRWEVLASFVTSTITYFLMIKDDPLAWKNFKVVLISTALTLAAFALWHLARSPWSVHSRIIAQDDFKDHWFFGALGFLAMAVILTGGYIVTSYSWQIRNIPMTIRIPAPQVQVVQVQPAAREAKDSLRRRTMRAADELYDYLKKRAEKQPPAASPNSNDPNPSEERKKEIQTWQRYQQETEDYYVKHFRDRTVGIVKEYESKGVPVHFLENDFKQRMPGLVPTGSVWEGMDDLSRFRDLAYHVDARDHLIVF